MELSVATLPALEDNYIFVLHNPEVKGVAVVDPGESQPVLDFLAAKNYDLAEIWCTHHHPDHTGANLELKRETGCRVLGSSADRARIPGIDVDYAGGSSFEFAGQEVKVFDTPGHTKGAVSYYLPKMGFLFCGDTLFAMGCGRLFEGDPEEMWNSLSIYRELPPSTKVYCAHEYTEANAAFALSVEPNNPALLRRAEEVCHLRANDQITIPTDIKQELATNPFLRAGMPDFKRELNMSEAKDWQVFAEVRQRKDVF